MKNELKYHLSRSKSLKSKILIEQLFKQGKSLKKYPLRLVYLPVNFSHEEKFLVAFSVSKKKFKRAVDRNRIKRLMREAFRLQQHDLLIDEKIIMMWIFTGSELPDYQEVYNSVRLIIREFNDTH